MSWRVRRDDGDDWGTGIVGVEEQDVESMEEEHGLKDSGMAQQDIT